MPLYEEHINVVASARSQWARRRKLALGDLVNEPWLHMPQGVVIQPALEQAFQTNKVSSFTRKGDFPLNAN
jgi:DNA-binding transcriptional LysR family regulator